MEEADSNGRRGEQKECQLCSDLSARSRGTPLAFLSPELCGNMQLEAAAVGRSSAAGLRMRSHLFELDASSGSTGNATTSLRFQGSQVVKCDSMMQSWSSSCFSRKLPTRSGPCSGLPCQCLMTSDRELCFRSSTQRQEPCGHLQLTAAVDRLRAAGDSTAVLRPCSHLLRKACRRGALTFTSTRPLVDHQLAFCKQRQLL
ncbi:unnamed protein product [Effrenium voratum]|nr:unnamed protein product [Effrenium voratum]